MSFLAALACSLLVVIALTLLELRAKRRGGDWLVNLQAWAVNLVAALTVYRLFAVWHGPALIDGAALPLWLGIALFIVVQDLGEYLFHRVQHAIPWLWAMHSLHHSDPEMSALTTSRHFWGDRLIKSLTVWPAAYLVIAPTPEALTVYAITSLWHYVAHANLPLDFGRWSWMLNSPAYHRRHHSSLPEHYDSNFAALFPIFDVIAGSYHRPVDYPPTGFERRPGNAIELLGWPLIARGRAKTQAAVDAAALCEPAGRAEA
ncbi:MAG: sterol desaturase family protein [Novosphingobium sp.]